VYIPHTAVYSSLINNSTEKVQTMNRFASTLAVSALLAASLGFAAPANAAPATSWDCDTTGRTQCTNKVLEDAWDSFDSLKHPPRYDDHHVLRYTKTYHSKPKSNSHYVVVKSITKSKTWYVFSYKK